MARTKVESTEEQITIPEMDTPLGQAGDRYVAATEKHIKLEKELDELNEEVLKLMSKEGLDKCAFLGKQIKVTVRREHVESHDKLKRSISENKE